MSQQPYHVLLVGAGEINFGSPEGPWNHTARLEAILGDRLNVLGIIDPDTARSVERIETKRSDAKLASSWSAARPFPSVEAASTALTDQPIDLVVLGCPPHFRGTTEKGRDMDVQVLRAFGRARGLLIEKPIAALDPEKADCDEVARLLEEWENEGKVVAVGYMLRYLKAVTKMREILAGHHLTPTCLNARYFMAYEWARKLSWWNKAVSCGPVVEQASHFVDLVRFIAGLDNPVVLDSVRATALEHDEPAGKLSKLGFDEEQIPPQERVPRVTSAFWRHEKGTIGTLIHGITLHGTTYDTEFELLADGWVMRLRDAYGASPTLSIRRPGAAKEEVMTFENDDPFLSEFQAIVSATQGDAETSSPASKPLSSFGDALETYRLTWRIRHASEDKGGAGAGVGERA